MKPILFILSLFCFSISSNAQEKIDSSNNQCDVVVDTSQYATLFVYRKRDFVGSAVSYNLHQSDSIICRIKNNSKYVVRIYKEGPIEIWAKTEKKVIVKINVEFGKEYFIKCGLKTGILEGRPELELVYPEQGRLDFANVEGRQSDKNEHGN